MVRIYTLTLAPSLDSATITPQIYPEGKLRCSAPVFEPGGGGCEGLDASEPARPRRVQRRTVSFCYARRHAGR